MLTGANNYLHAIALRLLTVFNNAKNSDIVRQLFFWDEFGTQSRRKTCLWQAIVGDAAGSTRRFNAE